AALVTGSAVIMKPAPQSRRCGALIGRLLHEAGVPDGVFTLVDVPEDEVGRSLIADPRVSQLILTGASDTAALFASWRPELRILAETSGKNSIIVTPPADLDLAAHHVAPLLGPAGRRGAEPARGDAHRPDRADGSGDRAARGEAPLGAHRARGGRDVAVPSAAAGRGRSSLLPGRAHRGAGGVCLPP